MSYTKFKKTVLANAKYSCEVPGHEDELADQCHHFLKQSTYPEYREDPDNGMACSGACHAEIERRQRTGEDWLSMYPAARYGKMLRKAGLWPGSPSS